MRILTMAVAAIVAWCAVADVPTQAEFTAAGKVIADLMEPQMAAMKSGKKKSAEVADYAMSLMGESDTAAAKFLLAWRAYGLYMKGGAYDKAVEAIGAMRTAVPDMSNERMLKAVQPDAQNISEKKAPAVYAIIADLRGKVRSQNEIVKLEGALKKAKVSERPSISRQLGECHAVTGDWKKALEHFAKSGGDVAAMAKAEAGGTADANKLAGFWWDYSENLTVKKSVSAAMRQHAVALYKKGLADGTISGLNKKLAEQRVSDNPAQTSFEVKDIKSESVFKVNAHAGDICKISLSDKCDMDFIYCPAGTFKMGYAEAPNVAPLRSIRISRSFWMSKKRVTKRQLLSVGIKSDDKDETAFVHNPEQTIDVISTVMTAKYGRLLPQGYIFRLATEAEYEYVSKANAKMGDERLTWGFAQKNVDSPWGVENMFVDKLCFADCVPKVDGKNFQQMGKWGTRLCKMDYSHQPSKDPIMYDDAGSPRHLRRQFDKEVAQLKFKLTSEVDGRLNGVAFYIVAAPAIDSLEKFPSK